MIRGASHILIVFLLTSAFSCSNGKSGITRVRKPDKGEMADLNRYLIQKDRDRILNYGERKGLNLKESSTGLFYQIKQEGTGSRLTDKSTISMEYRCSLLDGTECYSSEKLGPRQIELGKTQIETGLNEGLRMLNYGAEAVFILPPYLAFGFPGDGKMIPPRSVIVYEVKISAVK